MKQITKPSELVEAFHELADNDYPDRLVRFLLKRGPLERIPRKVTIYVNPIPELGPGYKRQIQKLNEMTFLSQAKFPPPRRYRLVEEKLSSFNPSSLSNILRRPQFKTVTLTLDEKKSSPETPVIMVHITAENLPSNTKSKFYFRLETAGRIHLGNTLIGDGVIELSPLPEGSDLKVLSFAFALTGNNSPVQAMFHPDFLGQNEDYRFKLSASSDGQVWSYMNTFNFEIKGGKIVATVP